MDKNVNIEYSKVADPFDTTMYEKAILYNAHSYVKVNVTKDRYYTKVDEVYKNGEYSYETREADDISYSYSDGLKEQAKSVDDEYREKFLQTLSPQNLTEQYRNRGPLPECIVKMHSPKDGWHYREYVGYLTENAEGNVCAMIVAYDVNEAMLRKEEQSKKDTEYREAQRQHNEDLKAALKKAEMASESKTAFLFNMSHDIRTPLNSLMGFIFMAERNINDKGALIDSIKKMKSAGRQLSEMLDSLLELSRIESGDFEIAARPFSISAVGTEQEIVLVSAMEEKHIFFESSVKNISDMYVVGDKTHISQVVYNVMSNAVKYTKPNGTIKYCFEQMDDDADGRARYRWTIADDGIGMSKEYIPHIFERFSREKNTTMSGVEGTGLGMALVKEIIDKMGGTIEVISEKDNGTTVSFEIPMEKSDIKSVNAETMESTSDREISLKNRHVLIVEDNDLNRDMLCDLLEHEGMIPEGAVDGADAADKIINNGPGHYDVILMDIQMPCMDGYHATMVIKEICGNTKVPIVGLSANAFKEDVSKAFAAGMCDYLAKPVDIDVMRKTLKRVIRQSEV